MRTVSQSIHRKSQTAEFIDEKTGKIKRTVGSLSSNVNESEHTIYDNEN